MKVHFIQRMDVVPVTSMFTTFTLPTEFTLDGNEQHPLRFDTFRIVHA